MIEKKSYQISPSLQKKIDTAVKLINIAAGDSLVEVAYSGGKDSDVILELTKMAGVKYQAIYKNTTIDPVGTISHCKEVGAKIIQPKFTFFQLIEQNGLPTRRARFCCSKLKEYKVLDIAIHGIRRIESRSRAKNYSENDPIICRTYGAKENHVNVILPILSWTQKDIHEFILKRGIKCHPLYYDPSGNFHPERRLGCLGCPLKSDRGLSDYANNPKLFQCIVKSTKKWWESHPKANSHKKFGSVYGLVAHNLFYKNFSDFDRAKNSLFGEPDWKSILENYFSIPLP